MKYFLDVRIDCIAIRDMSVGVEDNELNGETNGVVWYRVGSISREEECEECGHVGTVYRVSNQDRWEAKEELQRLDPAAILDLAPKPEPEPHIKEGDWVYVPYYGPLRKPLPATVRVVRPPYCLVVMHHLSGRRAERHFLISDVNCKNWFPDF